MRSLVGKRSLHDPPRLTLASEYDLNGVEPRPACLLEFSEAGKVHPGFADVALRQRGTAVLRSERFPISERSNATVPRGILALST
ncbi:MAG: hypothetical protein AAGI72_01690 [Pseudomonadota bacterium]